MGVPRSLVSRQPLADLDLRLAHGTWPDDLGGEVFISTSDQSTAPAHAFFGDGWIVRLSLRPGTFGAPLDRFAWRAKLIDSPSARLRAACPDVFVGGPIGTTSPFGYSNAANTAPLPWGDRLFATWDAGRPVEIDPVTLGFLGEVGHRADWNPAFDFPVLPMIPSTAHPMIDPERDCLWTVSLNPMVGQVEVIRYDGDGPHVRRWPVRDGVVPQSMHTLAQTRDWLVLVDCAFRVDPAELGGAERSLTNLTEEPVYLLRKDRIEATPAGEPVDATAFRVGPEVMHYYAAHDDSDGVCVLFEHTIDTDLAFALRPDDVDVCGRPVDPALAGLYNHPMHAGVLSLLRFDPETGTVTERASFTDPERYWATQLSAIDWSFEGTCRPTVHHMVFNGYWPETISQRALRAYAERVEASGGLPPHERPAALVTLDHDTLQPRSEHFFGPDDYPTSPCFVPRDPGGAEATSRYAGREPGGHDGYVVVPVQNDAGFRVEVFDAADVGAGPVATLATAGGATVPFLIHSAWMPRAVTAPEVERLSFADELDERVASLPDDLQHAVHQVADDLSPK